MKTLFLVFFFLSGIVWARDAERPLGELKLEYGLVIPRYEFEIKSPKGTTGDRALYKPHNPSMTALGLGYRNLQFQILLANPNEAAKKELYGNSKATDFRLRYFGENTFEFFIQKYKGYFIDNSAALDSAYVNTDQKIIRPDIRTSNWGLNFYHSWDESSFSQGIAFDQVVPIKDSGWGTSWFLHGSSSSIDSDLALIPSSSQSQFGLYGDLEDIDRKTLALGLGIGGISTIDHWYLAGFVGFGIGYQSFDVKLATLGKKQFNSAGEFVTSRVGIGYNGKKHVAGFQILGDNVITNFADGEINGSSMDLKFFYAYRFQDIDIGFLNNFSNWISGFSWKKWISEEKDAP